MPMIPFASRIYHSTQLWVRALISRSLAIEPAASIHSIPQAVAPRVITQPITGESTSTKAIILTTMLRCLFSIFLHYVYLLTLCAACLDGFSSTHALKSRTDIIFKGSRLYLKHNSFTEVCSCDNIQMITFLLQFYSHFQGCLIL